MINPNVDPLVLANPAYWGGIDIEDKTHFDEPWQQPEEIILPVSEAKAAYGALIKCLEQAMDDNVTEFPRYTEGRFDGGRYATGTVLAFSTEALIKFLPGSFDNPEIIPQGDSIGVYDNITDCWKAHQSSGSNKFGISNFAVSNSVNYLRALSWGVVVKSDKHPATEMSVAFTKPQVDKHGRVKCEAPMKSDALRRANVLPIEINKIWTLSNEDNETSELPMRKMARLTEVRAILPGSGSPSRGERVRAKVTEFIDSLVPMPQPVLIPLPVPKR